jgi:ferritin-like metal-binding protein YciE
VPNRLLIVFAAIVAMVWVGKNLVHRQPSRTSGGRSHVSVRRLDTGTKRRAFRLMRKVTRRNPAMAAPETLKQIYIDELRDLWSANDQMQAAIKQLANKAGSSRLKAMLQQSADGVAAHTQVLKALVDANGGKHSKDHCKAMEGLVDEAKKHALDAHIKDDDARDVIIVAQYQRMSHYGLAGFGTAEAYARALGRADDEAKLKTMVGEIYQADEFASQLAEQSVNLAAKPS